MNSKKIIFRHTLIAICAFLLLAAPVQADEVDDYVRSQLVERHVPGVAVAVVKNGRVIKLQGYGVASAEFNAPVTADTVFEIGSVSKQMTAAGIMLLVEDGKVRLDEKISKYLSNTPESWRDITVRHLLTHTSGIKSYSSLDGFELSRRLKVADFIKQLSTHPLEFVPGERNIYSNSGYNLLAYIIEAVSGKPYMEFMRTRIFQPLGMTKTRDRDPQFVIANRATGYEWQVDRLTGRDGNLTDLMGAGSIVSTISDMVKWDAALRNDTLLKKESKAEIWKQFTFNDGKLSPYGLGWRISDFRGHKLIGHTGQTAGFGAAIFRYVDSDVSVITLTNLGEIGLGGTIAARIAKFYIPSISLRAMKPMPELEPKMSEAVLIVMRERAANKLNGNLITTDLLSSLSTERSKAISNRLSSFGVPNAIVYAGTDTINNKTVHRYRIDTPNRIFLWRVAFDSDKKISELTLEEEE